MTLPGESDWVLQVAVMLITAGKARFMALNAGLGHKLIFFLTRLAL
jgi:hypothetical protein